MDSSIPATGNRIPSRLIFIMGNTAPSKSPLSVELANSGIINTDKPILDRISAFLHKRYRALGGFDSVNSSELTQVRKPHHLLGDLYSVDYGDQLTCVRNHHRFLGDFDSVNSSELTQVRKPQHLLGDLFWVDYGDKLTYVRNLHRVLADFNSVNYGEVQENHVHKHHHLPGDFDSIDYGFIKQPKETKLSSDRCKAMIHMWKCEKKGWENARRNQTRKNEKRRDCIRKKDGRKVYV